MADDAPGSLVRVASVRELRARFESSTSPANGDKFLQSSPKKAARKISLDNYTRMESGKQLGGDSATSSQKRCSLDDSQLSLVQEQDIRHESRDEDYTRYVQTLPLKPRPDSVVRGGSLLRQQQEHFSRARFRGIQAPVTSPDDDDVTDRESPKEDSCPREGGNLSRLGPIGGSETEARFEHNVDVSYNTPTRTSDFASVSTSLPRTRVSKQVGDHDKIGVGRTLSAPKTAGRTVRKLGKIVYNDIEKTRQERAEILAETASESDQDLTSAARDDVIRVTGASSVAGADGGGTSCREAEVDDLNTSVVSRDGQMRSVSGQSHFNDDHVVGKQQATHQEPTEVVGRSSNTRPDVDFCFKVTDSSVTPILTNNDAIRSAESADATDNKADASVVTDDARRSDEQSAQDEAYERSKLLRRGPKHKMPVPLCLKVGIASQGNSPGRAKFSNQTGSHGDDINKNKKNNNATRTPTKTGSPPFRAQPGFNSKNSPSPPRTKPSFYLSPVQNSPLDGEAKLQEWLSKSCPAGNCTEGTVSPYVSTERTQKDLGSAIGSLQLQLMELRQQDIALLRQLNQMNELIREISSPGRRGDWSATLPSPVRSYAYGSVADLMQSARSRSPRRPSQPLVEDIREGLRHWEDDEKLSELPCLEEGKEPIETAGLRYKRARSVPHVHRVKPS